MSIVSLAKVGFIGHISDRPKTLSDLQEIGCLHLIPLTPEKETLSTSGSSSRAREALRFLNDCSHRRRQVSDPNKFDAVAVEGKTLALKDRIHALEDERDFLTRRIADLAPWGEFRFPAPEALDNLRLWFHVVPHKDMEAVLGSDLIWEVVSRDNRFNYVVVISEQEPEAMPVPRVHTGAKSLSDLKTRLEEVEVEQEDLQAERAGLTRWCALFARSIDRLEDQAAVHDAVEQTHEADPVFALQAWAPLDSIPRLEKYAGENGLVLDVAAPEPGETPPTLMQNPEYLAGGQDLVLFYMTPGYRLWDPSIIVFFSFMVFFAMIFADAGYSAALGVIVAVFWKQMAASGAGRRFRILLAALVGGGLVYGILVGSYFGVSPEKGSLPADLKILDIMDFNVMMKLSILLGVLHLILANAAAAWHWRRTSRVWVPSAWILIFAGGVILWLSPSAALTTLGILIMVSGMAGIVFFTSTEGPISKRLLSGLQGLTGLSNAFGDALSYLRLFALGLASASLAGTFNGMAGQVDAALPGIGFLFALLIAVLGHTMNFVLALSSGFIHGLRLNYMEFFRWSMPEEGYPFNAFTRKEKE